MLLLYLHNNIQGKVSGLWLVDFSAVNPVRGLQKFVTTVQKSVTTVQKSVTTEEPIKFDVGKRECKFS